jgi:hypothetical protein
MRPADLRVRFDRRVRVGKPGKLIPVPMGWIAAGRLTIVEKRNDMPVVRLVNAGDTPAVE